ncbi:MAG: GNAT family N-acetyltransferase [Tannerellaceae bacterium]|jgi:diamine N-acetyltransferase|nr:GNAT family N-acetyltransferase [Tannerellaceae bacterium]
MALLKNEHITLRALEPEDLMLLYRLENETSLWTVGNSLAPYSQYVLRQYIAESRRDIYELKQLRLIIEVNETGRAVGLIDLFDFDPHNRRSGTGILLDPDFQGNGIATEALLLLIEYAFSFLKLHQLYAHIPVGNKPSRALYARCGFTVAGTLTDWLADGEGFRDVLAVQLFSPNSSRDL